MFINTILYIRCSCARVARVDEVANDNQLKTNAYKTKKNFNGLEKRIKQQKGKE